MALVERKGFATRSSQPRPLIASCLSTPALRVTTSLPRWAFPPRWVCEAEGSR